MTLGQAGAVGSVQGFRRLGLAVGACPLAFLTGPLLLCAACLAGAPTREGGRKGRGTGLVGAFFIDGRVDLREEYAPLGSPSRQENDAVRSGRGGRGRGMGTRQVDAVLGESGEWPLVFVYLRADDGGGLFSRTAYRKGWAIKRMAARLGKGMGGLLKRCWKRRTSCSTPCPCSTRGAITPIRLSSAIYSC